MRDNTVGKMNVNEIDITSRTQWYPLSKILIQVFFKNRIELMSKKKSIVISINTTLPEVLVNPYV